MTKEKQTTSQQSVSKTIWAEIKDKDIDVFAMVSKVSDYCEYIDIDEKKCYLVCKATAVLPALEMALGSNYKCNSSDKYIVIEKV